MGNRINICHISDLHFGIYENKSFNPEDENFSLTNSLIEFISTKFNENEKPHFLIISGDLTSISDKVEYNQFSQFMESFIEEECFAKCYFDKYSEKDRTIVVPGNHDTVRKLKEGEKFGSDKLNSFRNNVVKKEFNTPFGNKKKYCFEINSVKTKTKRYPCPIPCALYYYPEYNILFPVLVSCYFAHKFNPKVLEIYNKYKQKYKQKVLNEKFFTKVEKDIEKIIYDDYGWFPQNYRRIVNRTFINFQKTRGFSEDEYRNLMKLAVTHHHVVPLEPPYSNTKDARPMLELLCKRGVIAILHGHLHYVLEEYHLPDRWKDISSLFSCGTVSAYCRNTVNKFNMIEIQNYRDIRNMTIKILCYEVNTRGYFTKTNVRRLYSKRIKEFLKSMNDAL